MSAFQQALANASTQAQPSSSGSSVSIRGSAAGGAPSARGLASALRGAGIAAERGMDLDGGGGRRGRPARSVARSAGGPLDQTGRHRPAAAPYAKPPGDRAGPGRSSQSARNGGPPTLAERMGRGGTRLAATLGNSRRLPEGTPPILKGAIGPEQREARKHAHAKLNEKLGSEDMKQWIRSRQIAPGVMDMSRLQDDPWLKEQGILPPGHPDAPMNAGTVFWRLIDAVIQISENVHIRTLSLANNNFKTLHQLARLPYSLAWLEALDLSNNPITHFGEFDALRAAGEKKGKATSGVGSLNNLTELKLNGCLFRERMLSQGGTGSDEKYQHEILKKFPGLLVLDGVQLNRVVFPLRRQPKVRRTDDERHALRNVPFTYPADVQPGHMDNEMVRQFIMAFCAKYYPLFDGDRSQLLPAYAPNATISINANTLNARSALAAQVSKTRSSRPNPVTFEGWTSLPSRNFFRPHESAAERMQSLKFPGDTDGLLKWWNERVPKTRHPLQEAAKWCFDGWVLDGEGADTKLCATVQGEFQEMPSGTYRSFSRTFILADAPQGSPTQSAGWPAMVLSDIMTVHSYLSPGAFDDNRSLIRDGLQILPPPTSSAPAPPSVDGNGLTPEQEALVQQLRQQTRMTAQFATLCLSQNGWVFETALKNFEEIRQTIPAEAFE